VVQQGNDNAVIPKSEAFFDVNHGWKASETNLLRGVEFDYGQHWYWYQMSRILTLNGTTIIYLPRDFTLSLGATGVRSAFSGTGAEWRPSGMTRLGFPLANWGEKRLSGSIFFAAGHGRVRANRSDWEIRFTNLRWRIALPDKRPAGRNGLRLVSETHPGQNGHKFWIELWNPFLKNSGG